LISYFDLMKFDLLILTRYSAKNQVKTKLLFGPKKTVFQLEFVVGRSEAPKRNVCDSNRPNDLCR
jgi:hypothetical protein